MKYLIFFLLVCLSIGPSNAQDFLDGETYFNEEEYVEYLRGNLPLVLSVPHGGEKEPIEIPDRDCNGCVYINDAFTQELAREIVDEIYSLTGCFPHSVFNRLHRSKFDANRALIEAADRNEIIEKSWYDYHAFLDSSITRVVRQYSKGLLIDLHGHGHDIQRLELGYLLTKQDLMNNNEGLNDATLINRSSIKNLSGNNLLDLDHAALIRGEKSLGTILENKGFDAVPSLLDPAPESNQPYFKGGYNTDRYGSHNGGTIDAIQIECNQDVRFNSNDRREFAKAMAQTLLEYLDDLYIDDFASNYCNTTGVEGLSQQKFFVFPNPVQTMLSLKSDKYPFKIALYNNIGEVLRIETIISDDQLIDMIDFPRGVYYLTGWGQSNFLGSLKFIKN